MMVTERYLMMIFRCLILIGLVSLSMAVSAQVNLINSKQDPILNTTLVGIINQLDAILPLIEQGKAEQARLLPLPKRFEFERYKTVDGVIHDGLKQDILAIRKALVNTINQTPLVPGYVKPLARDYTNTPSLNLKQSK